MSRMGAAGSSITPVGSRGRSESAETVRTGATLGDAADAAAAGAGAGVGAGAGAQAATAAQADSTTVRRLIRSSEMAVRTKWWIGRF
jgi:hypothetical protein